MRRPASPYASSFSFGFSPISSAMKLLIGANVVVFIAQLVLPVITEAFGLHPAWVVPSVFSLRPEHSLWIWQIATYMFLHGGLFHILFNMLALWMFGAELERVWGTRYFLKFYFVTGIGAGALTVLFSLLPFDFARQLQLSNVIGASGAIYGLLLAFGMLFPEQEILVMFLFPIKAKYMVMIFGGIAFVFSFQRGSTVSNLAHLGGMIFGYVYIRTQFGARRKATVRLDLRQRWKEYKLQHARKKFKVYLKKHGSDDGPWVN